jgi:hypothetical protein
MMSLEGQTSSMYKGQGGRKLCDELTKFCSMSEIEIEIDTKFESASGATFKTWTQNENQISHQNGFKASTLISPIPRVSRGKANVEFRSTDSPVELGCYMNSFAE